MKRWALFRPVIAGGAIWSWAAGIPARDVDIWMYSPISLLLDSGVDFMGGAHELRFERVQETLGETSSSIPGLMRFLASITSMGLLPYMALGVM